MSKNATAEQLKFAYWVPNVSGGLVTSTIDQSTDWGFEYNKELAVRAERAGFDYALSQVRYMASYGAEYQHESSSFSLALLQCWPPNGSRSSPRSIPGCGTPECSPSSALPRTICPAAASQSMWSVGGSRQNSPRSVSRG